MYPPETIAAFAAPQGAARPGAASSTPASSSTPSRSTQGLRLLASPPRRPRRTAIELRRRGRAGARRRGLQRQRRVPRARGAAMCPSFQALGDERHSTRGRAVLLRAALEGRLAGGLADDGLHEALELCLGCKACAAECPAQVDMARLKVEALAHRHRARGRPARGPRSPATRTSCWPSARARPRLARLGARARRARAGQPPVPVPGAALAPRPAAGGADGPEVVLMADTFTRFLDPGVGEAAVRVLRRRRRRRAAWSIPAAAAARCCRRAWWPPRARGARRALDRLAPHAVAGRPIVMLEPSCWSMLVDDVPAPACPATPARAGWPTPPSPFERAVADLGAAAAARRRRGRRGARPLPRPRARRRRARAPPRWPACPGLALPRLGRRVLRHGRRVRLPPPRAVAAHRRGPAGAGRAGRRRGGRGGHLVPRADPPHHRPRRRSTRPSTWPRGSRERRPARRARGGRAAGRWRWRPPLAARPGYRIAADAVPRATWPRRGRMLEQARSWRAARAPRPRADIDYVLRLAGALPAAPDSPRGAGAPSRARCASTPGGTRAAPAPSSRDHRARPGRGALHLLGRAAASR